MAELDEHVPTELERLILAAGAEDGPTAAEMGRAAQALGIPHALVPLATGMKVGVDGGSAIAAKTGGKVAAWVKWLTLGVGAVGAVAVGATLVDGPSEPAGVVEARVVVHRDSERDAQNAPEKTDAVLPERVEAAPTSDVERVSPVDKAHNPSRPVTAPSVPAESKLGDEIALLDVARRALGRGSSSGALSALAEYGKKHPNGIMRQEATLLRLEALQKAGRRAEARALGQRLIRRNPSSPHRKRIESLVGPL